MESWNQGLKESGIEEFRDSQNHGVVESWNQGLKESGNEEFRDS